MPFKYVATTLLVPPIPLLFVALAGLLIERRYRRVGCFLAWFGVLGLLVLAIPAVGGLLLAILSVRNHTAHIAGVDLLVFSAVGFDWLALWIPRPR